MKRSLNLAIIILCLRVTTAPAAITVTKIAQGCEANHSLFIKSDGSLWGMGANGFGELGDGTYSTTNKAEEIVASDVTAIAAGGYHSLFVKSDGSLWAMGRNDSGQLGDGTYTDTNKPEEIISSGVTAVAAGYKFSLFLKSDGSLWAMGDDSFGQLGDGFGQLGTPNYNATTNQPEEIVASGVTDIAAAGGGRSMFLKSDGSLWAMGDNDYGPFGDGTAYYAYVPEEIFASGIIAIAAGSNHSLFLKSDGSLWAAGANSAGELGDGTYTTTGQPQEIVAGGVTAVSAGNDFSLFLKSDGSLWGMGDYAFGQLGGGTYYSGSSLTTNQPEQIVVVGVTAIAAGAEQSLFLKTDGSLWGMGRNDSGQLGDGFSDYLATPEQIYPSPQPVLAETISFNTNLQFAATCGFGGNFYLLSGTNLTQPLSAWRPVSTNSVTTRGINNFSTTLTNAVQSVSQQFYILQSQ
jgi:alpha-tubulin suppressor-like RCC1 family protein